MKKIITTIFILQSFLCFAQSRHIDFLLGKTDVEVTHYMDSMNFLKINPYFKIEKGLNSYGALTLSADFALADEYLFNCTALVTVFKRVEGTERCVRTIVMGNNTYSQKNINYVKDNFTLLPNGIWQLDFNEKLNAQATIDIHEKYYLITYNLVLK